MKAFWRNNVLGINRRNVEYVFALNPRRRFPLADDKVKSKSLLQGADLPVPRTIAIARERNEIRQTLQTLESEEAFVVKPARGFGGQGVLLLRRHNGGWRTPSGKNIHPDELTFHMAGILSGMFSLDHLMDHVLVEERLQELPLLSELHGARGVSDIRVILARSKPVMAMLRLPSKKSGGSANLHQGGVGVGIDMKTGQTTFSFFDSSPIESHPDSRMPLAGVSIPHWPRILDICRPINQIFGMDYLGVDVVLDAQRGPVILEVNVRPGLAVQLANRMGLRASLETEVT